MKLVRSAAATLLACVLVIGGGSRVARADHSCDHPPTAPAPIPPPKLAPASIKPADDRVRLAHNTSVRRLYTLTRPESPTPVDVFFLVDGTNSMAEEICGVQLGLIDIALALHDAGIDAKFGVGEYRDYPLPGYGSGDSQAYRRRRAIGPLDDLLMERVARLSAHGGTQSGHTSALAALYQAATGQGQDVRPRGRSEADIPRDRGANFRPDALRIIVNVTDFAFRRPERHDDYPGPSFDKVAQALRERGVLQIGIDAEDAVDLRPMARQTGALAPDGGVDCDADGRLDLQGGDALVCEIPPPPIVSFGETPNELELAPAIIEMVKAVRDFASVHYDAAGDPRIVGKVSPRFSDSIDLKSDNVQRFAVRYRCGQRAGIERVRLTASVRNDVIARAVTRVTCGSPPSLPFVAAPAAAAAAPTTARAPQPHAQSQAQGQANTALQPNIAVVPQQQGQLQVALQQANDDEVGLSMSARRRAPVSPLFPAAVAVLTLGAGLAFARERARTQKVHVRKKEHR